MRHLQPLLVLLHLQLELLICDHTVLVSVLVSEHVRHNLLHSQARFYATFPIFHLLFDKLSKLNRVRK